MTPARGDDFAAAYARLAAELDAAAHHVGDELASRPDFAQMLCRRLSCVALLGEGDASFPGRALEVLAAGSSPVPVASVDGIALPAWVGEDALVLAVAGGDEDPEPGAPPGAVEAAARGATVVVVHGATARAPGAAVAGPFVAHLEVPWPVRRARAHLGSHLGALVILAEHAGVMLDGSAALERAVAQATVRRVGLEAPGGGPAGALARRLGRTVPLVVGSTPLSALAATRFKAAVNENAKSPAFSSGARFAAEDACGFGLLGDVTRQLISLVVLRVNADAPASAWREDVVEELLGEVVASVQVLDAEGEGPLAQLLDLVQVLDAVSLRLGALDELDAAPVLATEALRRA